MLAKWDDSDDWRIHAYNQGKYLVHKSLRGETLSEDPVKQGDERLGSDRGPHIQASSVLEIREFETMATAAREGRERDRRN